MIKNIIKLLLLLCAASAFLWLYQNSGNIVFDALGYHIETSFALFLLLLIIALSILFISLRILFFIFGIPKEIKNFLYSYRNVNIPSKLEDLLIAIYNRDYKKASHIYKRISPHISSNLANILNLDVASLNDDASEIKFSFMKLAQNKETRIAGIEGLITIAKQEENWGEMIDYCEQLLKIHKSEWLVSHFIYALIMDGKWEKLITFLENAREAKLLLKTTRRKLLAVAYYKLAHNAFLTRDNQTAFKHTMLSYNNLNNFAPNMILSAQIKILEGRYDECIKFIKKVWQVEPNFTAAELLLSLQGYYSQDKFLKIVKSIISYKPKHYESDLILAQAALKVEKYQQALDAISHALEQGTKFRACINMAEYCEKTHGNINEVIDWLKRAINSEIDVFHSLYFWDFNSMDITQSPTSSCFPIARL